LLEPEISLLFFIFFMLFTELELKDSILRGLKDLGYENTTPIQEQTIVAFANGKDIVGQSQTGTGKTAAFTLPLLNKLDPDLKKVQALLLVPTRELAVQTQEEFFNLGRYARVRALAAYGGRSIHFQKKLLDEGMQVAVCTPGRAIDLIERGYIDPSFIEYFVLDEVDRMLDMGFVDDVEWMWAQCKNIKQTMLFSATITSEVKNIINNHLQPDHTFIQIEPENVVVSNIDHAFVMAPHISKPDLLINWIETHKEHKIIIFTQTKYAVADLEDMLYKKGYSVWQLSGDMEQRDRMSTLKAYKENQIKILVATDVASRGLNMKDIDLVINFDVPQDPESYVHRIGRTARAGKTGKAIMFVSEGEMKSVQTIERRNKIKIKQIDAEGNEVVRSESRSRSGGSRFGGGSRWGSRFWGGSRGGRSFGGDRDRNSAPTDRDARVSRFSWERNERAPRAEGGISSERTFDAGRMSYSSGERRRPSSSRFGWDRNPASAGRGWDRTPRSFGGDRAPREGGSRFGGERSRPSGDRSVSSSRYPASAGRGGRPERPSTKSLMQDFIPAAKPERGNYRGRE
jgi:ATP-dependent RNA helicase DeaD